jgi:bifunctional non-homologous end joining protein LigD
MPGIKRARFKAADAKQPMPLEVRPMMAQTSAKPSDDPEWIFEMKWDGYRAIATITSEHVDLWSRNGLSLTKKYDPIVTELSRLKLKSAILDGEIAVLDSDGSLDWNFSRGFRATEKRTHVLRFRSALPKWRGPDGGFPWYAGERF